MITSKKIIAQVYLYLFNYFSGKETHKRLAIFQTANLMGFVITLNFMTVIHILFSYLGYDLGKWYIFLWIFPWLCHFAGFYLLNMPIYFNVEGNRISKGNGIVFWMIFIVSKILFFTSFFCYNAILYGG